MQTKAGAKKAVQTNYERYGLNFYRGVGRRAGLVRTENTWRKGWGTHRDKASEAGRLGGATSRRPKAC